MCGITGIIYFDKEHKVDKNILKDMTDSLYHRGPDDEGFYMNENVGLGFRRLSIIDLNTGNQPLSNEDGRFWIVFNGEIYNYLELRTDLLSKGHVFKTKTDTETIVHLYEQYGVECLQYLQGMFAFAIWDNQKKQLFVARDRFGIKPFYYALTQNGFVFGSEIKAITKSGIVNKTFDFSALDSYFAYGYITSDKSIYSEIKKLSPANYAILDLSSAPKLSFQEYWSIQFEPDYSRSEAQWIEELRFLFSKSVKMHMMSDVPIGAFLSGGIDSSSIVAEMSKNSNYPIQTFSLGFREKTFDELPFAREMANKYNTEHHELIIESQSIDLLPKIINLYDEPFADSSAIPTFILSEFTRKFVTVALSGDGGDELFGGYNNYSKMNWINKFNIDFADINKFFWGSINKILPESFYGKGSTYYLSQNKADLAAYFCIWTREERHRLFNQNLNSYSDFESIESFKEKILRKGENDEYLSNNQKLDMQTYLVDDILTKVDRASMYHSLEVRIPLLDHKFAELTFKIPSKLKIKRSSQKYILKKAMAPLLTRSVLNHRKHGFSIPLRYWFKDDLRSYVNDSLNSGNSLLSNYVDKKVISRLLDENQKGMRNLSAKVWTLLVFNEWLIQNNQ